MARARSRIGITLGDPAGVGPDLVARVLSADAAGEPRGEELVVFGDRRVLEQAAARRGLSLPSDLSLVEVTSLEGIVPGRPTAACGAAQVGYLEAAVAEARAGRLDALVTAPIHKALCREAGFTFPGHTEFLAERLGARRVAMMLAGPHLKVVPATIHTSLASVPSLLAADPAALAETLALTVVALKLEFGLPRPRVAVAALNPHAGESGHFGDEESRLIGPAIEAARALLGAREAMVEGRDFLLDGPHVPDAIYRAAAAPPFGEGRYDAVVGMYHDQALIPVKLIDFDEAVNVTLGLPLPRTSPDHGVAYEVAGTDAVRDTSFRAALALSRLLARNKKT